MTLTLMALPICFPSSSSGTLVLKVVGLKPWRRNISDFVIRRSSVEIQWPWYRLREMHGDWLRIQPIREGVASQSTIIGSWCQLMFCRDVCILALVMLFCDCVLSVVC